MRVIVQYSDKNGNLFTTRPIPKEMAESFLNTPGMYARVIKEIPDGTGHIPSQTRR